MAKGNDGNLLQHGVEAELGVRLWEAGGRQRLHLVLTHGMAPFEPFEPRGDNPSAYRKLARWLSEPMPDVRSPAIVRAYQQLQASPQRYPNSGEILAALVGRGNLSGYICETDPRKITALRNAWHGTAVEPLHGSWRHCVSRLRCPVDSPSPWLFSMDPMTFVDGPSEDDDKLRESDLRLLVPILESYAASGQPGACAIFCYSLRPDDRERFRAAIHAQLVSYVRGFSVDFLKTVARGGNRHIGAVLCSSVGLLGEVRKAWQVLCAADGEEARET
jgi:hypothetical protein